MPSFTGLSPNSAALESVLWTEDLWRRPSRPADHAAENRALVAVASEMAIRPDGVLQRLAEVALELCGAHSAGLSILEEENGRQVFRWQAAAGQWAPLRGGTMPREFSPCGTVLDRRSMELMVRPDRHFLPLVGVEPLIEELLLIPFRVGGETVGTIWLMAHDGTRRFDAEDLRLMTNLGNFASACLTMESLNATAAAHRDLQRTAAALRESEERLAMELADMAKLQEISTHILSPGDVDSLHDAILEAAVDVMRSDMGSMQLYHPDRGELQLLAQRGFHPESTKFWEWVRVESGSTCGAALRARKRVIAADIDTCDFILGTPDYDSYRLSGITAVQTTPLLSRSGRLLGMISNHWRKPHNPSQRDLRMLDVIARLAADLLERRQAESALKEADRRKDEFLATLAHELRNPLSPLTTGLEILKLGKDGAAFERTHAMMERQVGQMVRLIDDLLDVSRISRGKIALKAARIALAPVIERAIETCRPSIEQMGQQLSTSLPAEPIYLSADAVRLSQVVANLLSNASKFTPREGRIWLTAECHRDEDGNKPHVLITVKDTGVGIPQNMLPHIFEMFAQVDQSLERSHSGLGIGLTLAQRLVELHGGSLEAHSDGPGLGSEFIVRLGVLGEPAQGASPDAAKRSAASAHRRILVVDDNRDAADSLATLLSLRGHSVRIAYDGATAVETASAFLPDLVLLDIGMPKLNGFNTAQRIRALPQTRNALLIAVTGWGQKEDKRRSQAAGFDAHLVKPVDYGALLALLDSFKAEAPTLENF